MNRKALKKRIFDYEEYSIESASNKNDFSSQEQWEKQGSNERTSIK